MWTEQQLKGFGFNHEWTLSETIELLTDPQKIPCMGEIERYPNNPQSFRWLKPEEEESEVVVGRYSRMLKKAQEDSLVPNLRENFSNRGNSHPWDLGNSSFLNIYTSVCKSPSLGLILSINSPREYNALTIEDSSPVYKRLRDILRGKNHIN